MEPSPMNIQDIIFINRFQNSIGLVWFIIYIPFGLILGLLRFLIFGHALLILHIFSGISFIRNIVLHVVFATCGLVVTTDGDLEPGKPCAILASNHLTSLDPFILCLLMDHCLVFQSFLHNTCTLTIHLITVPADFGRVDAVQYCKRKLKVTEKKTVKKLLRKATVEQKYSTELKRQKTEENPKGAVTSSLPFQLSAGVKMVGITTYRYFFDSYVSTASSVWWQDLLLCFFLPVTVFRVKILPAMEQLQGETSEEFAERARGNLAQALTVPTTRFSAADVVGFLKRRPLHPGQDTHPVEPSTGSVTAEAEAAPVTEPEIALNAEPGIADMVRQVQDVLPNAERITIIGDIEKTKDVYATIVNLLEDTTNSESQNLTTDNITATVDVPTFKGESFSTSPAMRQSSLDERKLRMLDFARRRYSGKRCL